MYVFFFKRLLTFQIVLLEKSLPALSSHKYMHACILGDGLTRSRSGAMSACWALLDISQVSWCASAQIDPVIVGLYFFFLFPSA